jgi:hypothetical protein
MTPTPRAAAGRAPDWLVVSHVYGLVAALVMGYFLLRIPIQIHDCFTDMCALLQPMGRLMQDSLTLPGYFRPGRWVFQKAVFDVSGGHYVTAFRITQALQVVAVVALFVGQLRPRRAIDAALVPLGIAVLLGSHTFEWTVREAFPINHFLTIVVCCAAATRLALSRRRWWNDVAAAAIFVVAASTIETGLLVWVIVAGGYLLGMRGVSRAAVFGVTALMILYFVTRFVVLDVGTPGLELREAGFGFSRRTGDELAAMFGSRPLVFYAYNVAASFVTVLLSEPRHGVWSLSAGILQGSADPALIINVVSSILATAVVCRFAWTRRFAWRGGRLDDDDRIVLLFVLVLAANAVISYAYTKDAIMSPAGVLYAAAVFVAARDLVISLPARTRLGAVTASVVLLLLSSTWAVRWVGIHAALDRTAMDYRTQWTRIDEIMPRMRATLTPAETALRDRLQDDAIRRVAARTTVRDEWTKLFDTD